MTPLFLEAQASSSSDDWILLVGIVQFIVGVVQVIGAFVRTIYALFNKHSYKLLGIYWLMVALYFIVLKALSGYNPALLIYWIGTAWFIAIWYWSAIVFSKKKNN